MGSTMPQTTNNDQQKGPENESEGSVPDLLVTNKECEEDKDDAEIISSQIFNTSAVVEGNIPLRDDVWRTEKDPDGELKPLRFVEKSIPRNEKREREEEPQGSEEQTSSPNEERECKGVCFFDFVEKTYSDVSEEVEDPERKKRIIAKVEKYLNKNVLERNGHRVKSVNLWCAVPKLMELELEQEWRLTPSSCYDILQSISELRLQHVAREKHRFQVRFYIDQNKKIDPNVRIELLSINSDIQLGDFDCENCLEGYNIDDDLNTLTTSQASSNTPNKKEPTLLSMHYGEGLQPIFSTAFICWIIYLTQSKKGFSDNLLLDDSESKMNHFGTLVCDFSAFLHTFFFNELSAKRSKDVDYVAAHTCLLLEFFICKATTYKDVINPISIMPLQSMCDRMRCLMNYRFDYKAYPTSYSIHDTISYFESDSDSQSDSQSEPESDSPENVVKRQCIRS